MRVFRLVIALGWLVLLTPPAAATEQAITLAGLKVTVWSGEAAAGAEPIVIFSHGFHGCATQSRYLMNAIANAGYLVFAPNHADATCDGGPSRWIDRPEAPLRQPELWDETSYRARGEESIAKIIAALRADPAWRGRIDWSRLGLAGHSLGGYTVLGLAGAWPGWKIDGVRAVLALSPYSQPFVLKKTLGSLSAPVMYQGGDEDVAITPTVRKPDGTYDQSPMPKYYVEFEHAGHMAWTDVGLAKRDGIVAYSLAFLDHTLKGKPADPILTRAEPGVVTLRYDSELGRGG